MGTQGMDQQNEHKNCDSQKIARKPALRWVRRFAGNRKGVVAIEFAALAIPFSLLVFAILESCISFAAQQVLSAAALTYVAAAAQALSTILYYVFMLGGGRRRR